MDYYEPEDAKAEPMGKALELRRPSPLETTEKRIKDHIKELERLRELKKLLEENPHFNRILELMGNKY